MHTLPRRDTLGRRLQPIPTSSDKYVAPPERALIWFEALQNHGPLPLVYLHAFTKHRWTALNRASDLATDLFHEKNTPHGGPYLRRLSYTNDFARPCLYHLTHHARLALIDAGLYEEHAPSLKGPIQHDAMVACISASLELGCRAQPHAYQFIHEHEIIARTGHTLSFPVLVDHPALGNPKTIRLIPDRVCGVRYLARDTVRVFFIEADKGTEPHEGKWTKTPISRKSLLRNAVQYRQFIAGKEYKRFIPLNGGAVCLNFTTKPGRMNNIMATTAKLSSSGRASYVAYHTLPQFDRYNFHLPKKPIDIFSMPLERVGYETFVIAGP